MDTDPRERPEANALRELFEELAGLDAPKRQARLAELALPAGLRARLLAMLRAEDEDSSLLDQPVTVAIEQLLDAPDFIGSTIGPFRVLEVIGEGGFSIVFRAEREAGTGTQAVALKLMRTGLFSPEGRRRFQREQAILAQLTHPNITRLIEAGTTETGVPYIAMELVDGLPISDYAASAGLDFRRRLACFVAVCRAVETAHAALIVHRDLKPSNVLVDRHGDVKVLDFGIAKLLDDEDGPAHTRTQMLALTPEYAAPEQFRVGPVTIAADIYALGVLLGELLTGVRPGDSARRDGLSGLLAASPDHASPRGMPGRELLQRMLRGDLDAIVATAIAEAPEDRYRSAGMLADDVQRHLDGLPISAHPPTRWYRARKFVARHRGGVALTAALVLGILASLAMALVQARRASEEADLARATRDFMVDVFKQAEPAGPRLAPPSVADVTEAALSRVDAEQTNPRVRLDLKTQLGSVLRNQSRADRAIDILRAAGDEGARLLGEDHPLVFDARVALGDALTAGGQWQASEQLLHQMDARAARQDRQRRIAFGLFAAEILIRQRRPDEALQRVATLESLCDAGCNDRSRASILLTKGTILFETNRIADAAIAFEQALVVSERLHGPEHVQVSEALNGLADAYHRLGRLPEARAAIERANAIDDAVLPAFHWRRGHHLNTLGLIQYTMGETAQALSSFERAFEQGRAVNGDDDPSLASDIASIGALRLRLGQVEPGFEAMREAISRFTASQGEHGPRTSRIRANYGYNLVLFGGSDSDALPIVQRGVADLRAQGDGVRNYLYDAVRQLGKTHWLAGRYRDALAAFDEAQAIADDPAANLRESQALAVRIQRALAMLRLGRGDEAQALLDASLRRLRELDADLPTQAEALLGLAEIALDDTAPERHDCPRADARFREAVELIDAQPFVFAYMRAWRDRIAERIGRCRQQSGEQ